MYGRSGIATSSSSSLHPHSFYSRASNAICTANGRHFARARRRTKTLPDPWSLGALRGAILGDVAATSKMAGLAYEDGTGSASLSALNRNLLWLRPNSPKARQTVETHKIRTLQ